MRAGGLVIVLVALGAVGVAAAQISIEGAPLAEVVGDVCTPAFRSSCPTPTGATSECRVIRSARSRDGSVVAEIVADGVRIDLQAMHLVIRRGGRSWSRRELGHEGVGCGTFESFSASFVVEELRVADVLGGPEPEVVLRARSGASSQEAMVLCSTADPPMCVEHVVEAARLRFRRPDLVIVGPHTYRVVLAAGGTRP